MDFLPIVVMIVFVLAGGVIAVFADELGRRIGKRRLTLHRKIRPKTSARILAFTSGVLITIVTMILIGLASSDMRTLLLHGRQAIDDQKAEIGRLVTERDKLSGEIKTLSDRNARLASQIYSLESDRKALEERLGKEKAKLTEADGRLALLTTRARTVEQRAASITRDLGARKRELAALKREFAQKQQDFTKLQQSWNYLKNERDEMMKSRDDLDRQVAALTKEKANTQGQLDELKGKIDELQAQIASAQQELGDRQVQLDAKKAELAQLQETAQLVLSQMAQSTVEHTRQRPLIFAVGEELVRIPVPKQTSKAQAREKIESALLSAKKFAEERGAKNANRIDRADLYDLTDANGKIISSVESQKDSLSIDLAGSPDDQVLIIYSRLNAFAEEGVLVAMKHQPNPVIYHPGQVLAEVRVDGRQDRAKFIDSLNGLGIKIRQRALGDKMIPKQSGDSSFGSATSEDILDLYNQIRSSGGSVRVQAVAKRETRAADPLLLTFVVK